MSRRMQVHFVWSGPLAYTVRLGIEAAAMHMPDADLRLHVLQRPGRDRELDAVAWSTDVTIGSVDAGDLFDGLPDACHAYRRLVDRSGMASAAERLVRLAVLQHAGGVCIDAHALVVRGLPDPQEQGAFVGSFWAEPGAGVRLRAQRAVQRGVRRTMTNVGRGERPVLRDASGADQRVSEAIFGWSAGAEVGLHALELAVAAVDLDRGADQPVLDPLLRATPRLAAVLPPSRFHAIAPVDEYRYVEERHLALPLDAQAIALSGSTARRVERLTEDDPRFDRHTAPYWRAAQAVRIATRHQRRLRVAGAGQRDRTAQPARSYL